MEIIRYSNLARQPEITKENKSGDLLIKLAAMLIITAFFLMAIRQLRPRKENSIINNFDQDKEY